MRISLPSSLFAVAVAICVISLAGYVFATRGNSGFHENWRMDRVAKILEENEDIKSAYGPLCTVKRLDSGLQMSAVLGGIYGHISQFEVSTPNGPRLLSVNWYSCGQGLFADVSGFKELPDQ